MSEEHKLVVAADRVGALAQFVRTLRLVWRLLNDPRVPFPPKLVIPAAILYILSPIDLAPDFILGLGQLDDLGILLLSIPLFIELCPRAVVEEHRRALAATAQGASPSNGNVVEGTYRVMPEDDSQATP